MASSSTYYLSAKPIPGTKPSTVAVSDYVHGTLPSFRRHNLFVLNLFLYLLVQHLFTYSIYLSLQSDSLTPSICLLNCLLTPSVWTLCSLRRISRRGELEWAPISEPIGTEPPRWASADAVGRARGMCRCTEVALLYPTAGESGVLLGVA